jgi:hypothetical protein
VNDLAERALIVLRGELRELQPIACERQHVVKDSPGGAQSLQRHIGIYTHVDDDPDERSCTERHYDALADVSLAGRIAAVVKESRKRHIERET